MLTEAAELLMPVVDYVHQPHSAPALVVALILISFVFEDVAIGAGAALIASGMLSPLAAFLALALGISIGDLGLYGLGAGARQFSWLKRFAMHKRAHWLRGHMERRLVSAIMLARVVPGLRFATYSGAGFVGAPFSRFASVVVFLVLLWTAALLFAGSAALSWAKRTFGLEPFEMLAALIGVMLLLPLIVTRLRGRPAAA